MRIVLDTNVLARAAIPSSGPAREALLRCLQDPHVLIMSGFIVSELSRIMRYERMRRVHGLDDAAIDRYIADLESASCLVVLPADAPRSVVTHDCEDDSVVATAVVGKAEALCTLDRHLHHPEVVAYCRGNGIQVLDDVQLLAILRQSEADAD